MSENVTGVEKKTFLCYPLIPYVQKVASDRRWNQFDPGTGHNVRACPVPIDSFFILSCHAWHFFIFTGRRLFCAGAPKPSIWIANRLDIIGDSTLYDFRTPATSRRSRLTRLGWRFPFNSTDHHPHHKRDVLLHPNCCRTPCTTF